MITRKQAEPAYIAVKGIITDMSYVALYRKFRPKTLSQVKGQDHVVVTLKNQLVSGRIGHAYLFTGTRGTGKTSVAKIMAKALNCLNPQDGEPCCQCENCKAIEAGNFIDVSEVDAASNNGVDDIRRIIEEVRYNPAKGRYKVYIIDEAHMITAAAFNAFLKTLEEPPAYAVFILATTDPQKLPITILSRCQRYDFKRISTETISRNLAYITAGENVEAEEKALYYIARMGDGSMRDAVSLLDKCIAFNLKEKLTYENVLNTLGTVDTVVFSRLFRAVYSSDIPAALNEIDLAVDEGKDLSRFVTDFIWYLRNMLMAMVSDVGLLGLSEDNQRQLTKDAEMADSGTIMRYIRILSELLGQIRYAASKQVLVEICIIKLSKAQMENDLEALSDRIRQLEDKMADTSAAENTAAAAAAAENITAAMADTSAAAENIEAEFNSRGAEKQSQPFMQKEAAPGAAGDEAMKENDGAPCFFWSEIVDHCSSMRAKPVLARASAVVSQDGLHITVDNAFSAQLLKGAEISAEIKKSAAQALGREVNVQIHCRESNMSNDLTVATDRIMDPILKNINFTIGTEEN